MCIIFLEAKRTQKWSHPSETLDQANIPEGDVEIRKQPGTQMRRFLLGGFWLGWPVPVSEHVTQIAWDLNRGVLNQFFSLLLGSLAPMILNPQNRHEPHLCRECTVCAFLCKER